MTYWVHSAPDDVDLESGQRPCARGERCRSATAARGDDGTLRREPTLGPRTFCDTDRAEIARALSWLPERYLELATRLGDKQGGDGPKVSGGGASAPVPLRLDIDALMVQVINIIASWDERVRDIARLAARPGPQIPERRGSGTGEIALSRMCTTLSAHLDALLALPPASMCRYVSLQQAAELAATGTVVGLVRPAAGYAEVDRDLSGADAGLEMLTLDRRCQHMLGWTPQHQDLPVPCWACGLKTVRRWDGGAGLEDRAECSNPACCETYEDDRFTLLMGEVEKTARVRQSKAAS